MKKKVFAVIIVLALVLTMVPVAAFAVDTNTVGGSATFSAQDPAETQSQEEASASPNEGASAPAEKSASQSPSAAETAGGGADASPTLTDETSPSPGAAETAGTTPMEMVTPSQSVSKIATMGASPMGITVTVSFNSNGGSSVGSVNGLFVAIVLFSPNTTRDGYSFDGWYTDSVGGSKVSFPYSTTSNATLYAHWTRLYTITYNTMGGDSISSEQVNEGTAFTFPIPHKNGYTFKGWYLDQNLTQPAGTSAVITKNITLYAGWQINQYTITFNTNGGSTLSPVTQNYDTQILVAPATMQTGYTFKGWYLDDDFDHAASFPYTITKNAMLYAKWQANSYKLTITAGEHGRIITRGLLQDSYNYGKEVYLWYSGATADDNYDFDYWLDEETGAHFGGDFADTKITIDTDNRYKAIFKGEPRHLHTYAGDNGTLGNDLDGFYPHGSTVDLNTANPQPSTGYKFDHWEEQVESVFGPWKPMSSSIATVGFLNEYKAIFSKEQFTVTWQFGNGTPDKTITRDYGTNLTSEIPANPSKDGYQFTGWSYDGGTAADITSLKRNMTVIANYTQLAVSGVTVEGYDAPYDGQPHGVKINGDLTGLTVQYSTDGGGTFTGNAPAYSNVINKPVTVRVSKPNYTNYEQTVTINISKKPLTVTAEAKETTFGQAAPTFTAIYSGFAPGENETTLGTANLAFDCGYSTGNGVGTYDIMPKGLDSGWTDYDITYAKGTLTVNPASSADLAVSGLNITYDGKPHQATVLNLRQGDTVEYSTDNGGTYASDNPVFKDVTPAAGVTVTVRVTNPNYAAYTGSALMKINPATLTVTAKNAATTYGSAAPGFGYDIAGYVNGEDEAAAQISGVPAYACAYDISDAANRAVGLYDIVPDVLPMNSANYAFAPANGTLAVNPAPLTVTANDETVIYNDDAPAYSASFAGFVNGDDPSSLGGALSFASSYAKGSWLGTYPITVSGLTSNNYAIAFAPGTLTVNAAVTPTYRVVFQNYNGTLLKVLWVSQNNPASAPENPARPGYTFTGWSTSFDKVTQDMTITALFAPVAAAATVQPSAQPTVIPSQSAPAAAPSVSPSASASPSASQETIGENQVPQAAPSAGEQGQDQTQSGFPFWIWIIIAAAVAAFLIWLFGFRRRKREQH